MMVLVVDGGVVVLVVAILMAVHQDEDVESSWT